MREEIINYFDRLRKAIAGLNIDEIEAAVKAIKAAYDRDAVIYVFGNGGSAATASHFACDFNKGICENLEKKFRLVCLNDNIPMVTAIANDISYDDIFVFQMKNKLKAHDLVLAISGSGNSKNVIKAVEYAKEMGTGVVGITGFTGGRLRELADYSMHINVDDMQLTEDIHLAFDHMMYRVLKDALEGK